MNTETTETSAEAIAQSQKEKVDAALARIGRAIGTRRGILSLRQDDVSELTGIHSSRLSRIEGGKLDSRMSSIIIVLDALGLLDQMLDALPVCQDEDAPQRVCLSDTPVGNIAAKPLTVTQMMAFYEREPSIEMPVTTSASYALRRNGFAIRRSEHPTFGLVNYATHLDNARYSELAYDTETGPVGGYRHLKVVVASSLLSEELSDASSMMTDQIKEAINAVVDVYRIHVTELVVDSKATAHAAMIHDEHIESVFIYDKICEAINEGVWLK